MAHRFLILFMLIFACSDLYALNVECEGSTVVESTQELARENALNNSKVSCIKNALAKMYGDEIVLNNEWRLKKIYDSAASFISSSRLVYEEYDPELNAYKVTVESVVNDADLRTFVTENGIALSGGGLKTVLPLIVERTSEDGEGEFWWGNRGKFAPRKEFSDLEKALATYLSQGNFILMDPFENQATLNIPESYKYMEMRLSELAELGRIFGAGFVASGYIWTTCRKENNADKSICETTLSIQMISTETSKINAAKRATADWTAESVDEARTVSRARACKQVAESLLYQLSKKVDKRSASNFKVAVKGIMSYQSYLGLKKCMLGNQIPGLYSVVERYQARGLFVFEGERRTDTEIIKSSLESKCFYGNDSELIVADPNMIEVRI